jgi:hypothetical protein
MICDVHTKTTAYTRIWVRQHWVLPKVPVIVDIAVGGVIGLEGDRGAALSAARALLCQAVVGSGPADLTVAAVDGVQLAQPG